MKFVIAIGVVVAAMMSKAAGSYVSDAALQGSDRTYRSTESTAAGNLVWDIVDCATGKAIASGNKALSVRDFVVIEHRDDDGEGFYRKRIQLEQGFYLQMTEFGKESESEVTGFGLVAGREGETTFCWEWFDADGKSHATKLQETGALEISVKEIGGRWEVIKTSFLADVSLRIEPLGEGLTSQRELLWRVNIRKGSEVIWPSIVGSKVVSNRRSPS